MNRKMQKTFKKNMRFRRGWLAEHRAENLSLRENAKQNKTERKF